MSRILNNILCTAMIFVLTFAWAFYCIKDGHAALLIAMTVAACGCYLIFEVLGKVQRGKERKKEQKKQLKNFFDYLQFNADNEKLFEKMFEFFGFEVERKDFDSAIVCREKKSFVSLCFGAENLSHADLRRAVINAKRSECDNLIIFCNRAENNLRAAVAEQMQVKFVDLENTFSLFEQAEKLPKLPERKKQKIHIFPQYAFNKKRFVWYFGGAIFTLFTAAVSFLKVYLLVWSTVLFGLALFSLFNKKYNVAPTDVKLE